MSSIKKLYQIKTVDTFNLKQHLESSEDVNIVIVTSHNPTFSSAVCRCLFHYRGHRKLITIKLNDVISVNHAMSLALQIAIEQIRQQNLSICIISSECVGFVSAARKKGAKGTHKTEIKEILKIAKENNNTIKSIALTGGAHQLKTLVDNYQRRYDVDEHIEK